MPGAFDDEIDRGAAVAVLQKTSVRRQNLGASNLHREVWSAEPSQSPAWPPLALAKT